MSVAANIRKYCLRRLTQEQLAELLGKNRVTITKYELGQIDIPLSVINQLAKVLHVPVGKLLLADAERLGTRQ